MVLVVLVEVSVHLPRFTKELPGEGRWPFTPFKCYSPPPSIGEESYGGDGKRCPSLKKEKMKWS